ncbi:MAG TPA: C25 family cysteine peptidase [Ohtaekwangia sp.]
MKKFAAFLGVFFIASATFAQVGNEWINFSQSYFKIPIAKNGIYRLDYSALVAAGFPASSVDPVTIQIFHRGVEQAIHVEGEGDHIFDPADFIEFYGLRNDGTLDSLLYRPSSLQPHKYHNLYSDTTAYFLTYGAIAGKRMPLITENNSGQSAEPYHYDDKLTVLHNEYATGTDYDIQVQQSWFDLGEGWSGTWAHTGQTINYSISGITNTVTSGPAPTLEITILGRNRVPHRADVYVGAGMRLVATVDIGAFSFTTLHLPLLWSDIGSDGTMPIRVQSLVTTTPFSYISVSAFRLRYPQGFSMASSNEKIFSLPDAVDKSYIEVSNAPAGVTLFDISDPSNLKRIGTTTTSTLNAVVPAGDDRKILATNLFTVPAIRPVSFRQIIPSGNDYVIISHPLLRQPASGYSDPVKAYAEYRASAVGGGFDTLVLNVAQLYDQFTSGETTPLAIYRLMQYMAGIKAPRYLFLIGKGLDVGYGYHRSPHLFPVYKDLVPTAGTPGSDILFSAGLGGSTTYEPAVPTGRIPASKASDVAVYLEKVKEKEARSFDDLEKKNILHISGGIEAGEPERFKSHLSYLGDIARDYYLGAHVSSVAKQSFNVELINVAEEINKGLGLVTFFGHSSATSLDFDIGKVSNPVLGYDNEGKYPIFLINGCSVGSFFLNDFLFGEDWVLTGKKGAAGFIAHTAYAFEGTIRAYAENFYRVAYNDSSFIAKGVGDVMKETVRRYMQSATVNVMNITQVQQMLLLGDPAVSLFGASRSDLEINNENVSIESFSEEAVSALSDSVALKLIVRNFGQARPDTLQIQVKRYLNDNSMIVYDSLYPSVMYSDTLIFVIRKGRENNAGNNRFEITLDPDNVINELSETNNTALLDLLIPSNGTKNLYPAPFSIVNSTDVTLSFQATDIFSSTREFLLEVDTVHTFDSQYKKIFTVTGEILARQPFTLLGQDTLAYYWRTKLKDPLPGENETWTLSSFTYIDNGPEGWAQVHFPQYLENNEDGLLADASQRKFQFRETITSVDIITYGSDHPLTNKDVSVKIAGFEYNLSDKACRDNSISLIAFDRHSASPYMAIPFKWYNSGGRGCGRIPWVINNFVYTQMVTGNGDDLIAYVNNVPSGDSVVMYSIGDAAYANWPVAAKVKLGELGISVTQIDNLLPGEPVVIFGRKGLTPGSAKIFKASGSPVSLQPLDVKKTITGGYTFGSMSSTLIGPAQSWDSFVVRHELPEPSDQLSFDLIGIGLNGEEELLLDGITTDQALSGISATQYPYLRVVYHTEDNVNLTPAQLEKWLVLYTPVPEGVLIYDGPRETQTVQEGDVWKGNYGFINISDKVFTDSITVKFETFNQLQRSSYPQSIKIKSPLPGDTTLFTYAVDTHQKRGLNDINVFVNPRVLSEQYFDNNVLLLSNYLDVQHDIFRPVLDVSIDDRYVVNGDYVSSTPMIRVKVWDENKKVRKTTTEGMRIFLTYPCAVEDCEPTLIDLTGNEIQWSPATETSEFEIEFTPEKLEDGIYTLFVEGADADNNASGIESYEVTFQVSGEELVKISDPYPNPTRSDVYFSIMLGNDELPSEFSLEIIDLNGKPVTTLNQSDVEFHTGTNIIKWNTYTVNGNPLTGGVYVYKLSTSIGGKRYMRNGKLVLVR